MLLLPKGGIDRRWATYRVPWAGLHERQLRNEEGKSSTGIESRILLLYSRP